MPLTAGTRLGPYEILSPLGAGGMGEVYKAKDTRLERVVALKVLPGDFFEDEESIARFEREARMLASLNHPGIAHLYSFEEIPGSAGSQGRHLLSMELAEGQTLAERLLKGPLSLDQVLKTSVEIASALDAAHRAGIVHRDVKPGNVMLTKSGVKLLDFGLAKAAAPPVRQSDLTSKPTELQKNLTQKGTILGTVQYMSPEQLEGKEADARSDIFAFGAVLYEMATGKKAFSGASQASLISAIMRDDPKPVSSVQPLAPPALDRLVRTCLAKDPEDRWQSAGDVARELKWIGETQAQAGASAVRAPHRNNRERLAWAAAALVTLAAVAIAVASARRAPPQAVRMRSFLLPPAKGEFKTIGDNCGSLTISPDGRYVTFAAAVSDSRRMLWLRSLDEPAGHPIPGTEGAMFPFWSPDSRHLAFFSNGKLQKVDLAGGPPLSICDAPNGRSGSWSRDGIILFSPDTSTAIFQVPASGGTAAPVTTLDVARGEETHRWATFLPDGKRFLFLAASHAVGTKSESNGIYLASLGSRERRRLLQAASNAVYASGYLLTMRDQVLLAQPFDAKRGLLTENPLPLASDVQYDAGYMRGGFSASDHGVLVHASGTGGTASRLRWFDMATGKAVGEPFGDPAEYTGLAVAPDGSRIAAVINDPATGMSEIWLVDGRGVRTRFTFGAPASSPVFSPDGSHVAYAKRNAQGTEIFIRQTNGGGQEESIGRLDAQAQLTDWSPDGRFLALDYSKPGSRTRQDVWILPLFGERKPYPFLSTDAAEQLGNFSPDGRWISYLSDETGRQELYVVAFPGPGGKWQISSGGSLGGNWDAGGNLLFGSLDGSAMSADFKVSPAGVEVGAPRTVFRVMPFIAGPAFPSDHKRFVVSVPPEETGSARIALVANWTAGLSRE